MTVFISSVQKEFAKERKMLAKMIREDRLLRAFFAPFVFEESCAVSRRAQEVYLDAVRGCDIYLGLVGDEYGFVDANGISPTEREFDRATELGKIRLMFVRKNRMNQAASERRFLEKVGEQVTWHEFTTAKSLCDAVYDALFTYLRETEKIRTVHWDAAFDSGAVLTDLDREKIERFIPKARQKRRLKIASDATVEDVLEALNLLDERGRVANAAVLLFGKKPQKWFVQSELKCIQFWGTEVAKPVPSYRIFEGDVFELVDQALDFVMSRVDNYVGDRSTGATGEVDTGFELPETAIKEAIVNAVCHRDYASSASVQVMLFKDRLEILNPGTLPSGWTVDNLVKTHRSEPSNRVLAKPMQWAGYIEKAGTGTKDIVSKCLAKGLDRPQYIITPNEFRIVIWRAKSAVKSQAPQVAPQVTPQVAPQVPPQVAPQVARLLKGLRKGEFGAVELMAMVRIAGRKDFRVRYLEPLLNLGWIEMTIPEHPQSRLQKYRLTVKGRAVAETVSSRKGGGK